jgi:thioredoxin-like negative regulator of GroEL
LYTAAESKGKFLSYEKAWNVAKNSGDPMVVVFGADWCSPCRRMKSEVWNPLFETRKLDGFLVAYVDIDKEPEIYRKLVGQKVSVPTVLVYRKAEGGWQVKREKGYQSQAQLLEFLK